MAFMNDFVVSVLVNNKPQREISDNGRRTVRLGWDSEYSLRLKNKSPHRCVAEVEIDGVNISTLNKRFIIGPNESIDLERFVDDLSSGRRFKFVSATDPKNTGSIQDPTSPENGCIRVRFYRESMLNVTMDCSPWGDHRPWILNNTKIIGASTPTAGAAFCVTNCSTTGPIGVSTGVTSDKGATVEGGMSGQQFVQGSSFATEFYPTTIEIWLKGPQERPVAYPTPNDWHVEYVGGRPCIQYNTTPVYPVEWGIKDGWLRVVVSDFAFAKQFSHAKIVDNGIEILTNKFSVR